MSEDKCDAEPENNKIAEETSVNDQIAGGLAGLIDEET